AVLDHVSDDLVALAAGDSDADAVESSEWIGSGDRNRAAAANGVPDEDAGALRDVSLLVVGVRQQPYTVADPRRVAHRDTARVGPRVPDPGEPCHQMGEDGPARVALADIEGGIPGPGDQVVVQTAVPAVDRVDPVPAHVPHREEPPLKIVH